jgi:DNA-binding NarL/FixJ family response regulator
MAYSTNFASSILSGHDRLRVLAADSTSMSTQLLAEALARTNQFHVIEAPPTESAILSLAAREHPQVVLVSAEVAQTSPGNFELVRSLRSELPSARVVVMLDHSDPAAVVGAFRAGAHGIFCRTQSLRLLPKCIECVHAGQVWANSSELHHVLQALTKPAMMNFSHLGDSPLGAREMDVVRCVAEGLTNREIARRLKLTEHTVKNYLFRIFEKLGVSSRVEVVLYALGNGDRPVAASNRRPQPSGLRKPAVAISMPPTEKTTVN